MIVAKAIIDYEKKEYGSNEMKVCLKWKSDSAIRKKVHKMGQHWNNTENIFFIVYCLSSVFHGKSCVNSLSTIQVELTPQKNEHHWDAFAHIYYDETWTLKWDSIIFEKNMNFPGVLWLRHWNWLCSFYIARASHCSIFMRSLLDDNGTNTQTKRTHWMSNERFELGFYYGSLSWKANTRH